MISKEQKQKHLFETLCLLADENREVENEAGIEYKTIPVRLSLKFIEEIREWSEEE